ncbi:MAG: efflux RND transporter periplasmic adaptor subunit [Chitinophagaceae bacterium]|nr:efflux RND transporter periplasmic adaptor subunit [Chitinophagaceae bacterium]
MFRISILFTFISCILFTLFFLSSCKGKKTSTTTRETTPTIVDVMVATPQELTNIIEANGTVIANESVELRPEVSGRLTYLNVPEGKMVSKGTVLARINSADLAAQVQKSRVQMQLAMTTQERLKKLLDVQGINQADYDAVVNQVNSLRADIAYTQTLIDKTVIRAPFSGTIGLRKVSPGAYVSPATVIASIQQLGKPKIDFTLPEQYSELIKVGDLVDVNVDAASELRRKATIIALEPQANTQTRNVVVRALLNAGAANPGAFVKVYVSGSDTARKSIMVPTNTIIPDDRNSQLILVKNGKANFVTVETGLRSASNVEIVRGINIGDTVVVTGVLFARPNAILKVRNVKTLEQLGDPK